MKPWTAAALWFLTFIPLGLAILNKFDMTFFLSMIAVNVGLNVVLVASVAFLDMRESK